MTSSVTTQYSSVTTQYRLYTHIYLTLSVSYNNYYIKQTKFYTFYDNIFNQSINAQSPNACRSANHYRPHVTAPVHIVIHRHCVYPVMLGSSPCFQIPFL